MSFFISKTINSYRKKTITGRCIDMEPITEEYLQNIVDLRNQDKNTYFVNQTQKLTLSDQTAWYKKYLTRDNDLYWCIFNKKHQFIGTIRVYEIYMDGEIGTQGSFMIDEDFANEAPYAMEAELLSLDFMFDTLHVKNVINENRHDNKVMNNLSRKLGFEFLKNTVINGVKYNYYSLTYEQYKKHRIPIDNLITYWVNR